MRLTKSQIQFLGYRITDELQVAGYIDTEDPNTLMDAIVDLITEDLRKEDDLNEEVRSGSTVMARKSERRSRVPRDCSNWSKSVSPCEQGLIL